MKHIRDLLIAMAVVGLLVSIALPAFKDQAVKSRRADARTTLVEVMQQQEAFFIENNSYTLDLRNLGYSAENWNDSKDGAYQIRAMASNGSCGLPECIRLYVRPKNSDSQTGDLEYQLWSTGKKQYKVDGSWKDGWGA